MIQEQYDTGREAAPAVRARLGGLLWPLLAALGWIGLLLAGPSGVERQRLEWQVETLSLRGDLWLPAQAGAARPGVVLVHGVMSSRAQPTLAARSLAQAGMVVLVPDLRGYGASDPGDDSLEAHGRDVLSALALLRSQPGVDPRRVALAGHSMGASAAVAAAEIDGHVPYVAAIGMHGESSLPVEWITGRYDALHPPSVYDLKAAPKGSLLTVSPAANHHVEWHDAWILAHLQRRLEQALKLAPGPLAWRPWLGYWSAWLIGLGLLGVAAQLLRQQAQSYARLGIVTGLGGALLACGYFAWLDPGLCAQGLQLLLLAYVLAALPSPWLRRLLLIGLCFFAARETVSLLRGLPGMLSAPGDLLWFPVYLLQSLLYYPAAGLDLLRGLLFGHAQTRLEASWLLGGLLMLEWLFPQWWLRAGSGLQLPQQRQRPALIALATGLLVLAGMVWLRLQQGYLSPESMARTVAVLGTDLLPSLLLFALMIWGLLRRVKNESAAASS